MMLINEGIQQDIQYDNIVIINIIGPPTEEKNPPSPGSAYGLEQCDMN